MTHEAHEFEFAAPITKVERNPFAVLNVVPRLTSDLRSELRLISRVDLKTAPSISPNPALDAHPDIQVLLKELDSAADMPGFEGRERRKDLETLLLHVRQHLTLAHQLRSPSTESESGPWQWEQVRPFVDLLPDDKRSCYSVYDTVTPEDVRVLHAWLVAAAASLKSTLKKPLASKKYTALLSAAETLQGLIDKRATVVPEDVLYAHIHNLSDVIELEQEIAHPHDRIKIAYREKAGQFYQRTGGPTHEVGDALFKEASLAHKRLIDATEEGRATMAMDLVFGQNTALWTPEMRMTADPFRRQFEAIFALEQPLHAETVPCDACEGQGSIIVQNQNDYFPVPVVCDCCNGQGVLLASLEKLRKELEAEDAFEDEL